MENVMYIAAGAGAAAGAVALAPVIVGAAGFTAGGIAAGTVAAKMMSAAAVANGGGVVAGGTVAVLQSVGTSGTRASSGGTGKSEILFYCIYQGAAGASAATSAAATGVGAALGLLTKLFT